MYNEYCGSCVSSMVLKDHIQKCIKGQLSSLSDKISILLWKKKEFFMGRGILLLQKICCITAFQFEYRDMAYIHISLFLFMKYQKCDISHLSVHLLQYTSLHNYTMAINEVAETNKFTVKNVNKKYEGLYAKC
jgi:hypothetical protein